jgi:hypothetical protein
VSVFRVDGVFVRHVVVGKLRDVESVCSAGSDSDELIVAGCFDGIYFLSASGEVSMTLPCLGASGVAVHGDALFVHSYIGNMSVFLVYT